MIPKPNVKENPLSLATEDSLHLSRMNNKDWAHDNIDDLKTKWTEKGGVFKDIADRIPEEVVGDYDGVFASIKGVIDEHSGVITDSQKMGLSALKLVLSTKEGIMGTTLDGDSLNEMQDSAIEFMMQYYLERELGTITAVSCKSGEDRTGTGAAIIAAIHKFEDVNGGASFTPSKDNKPWDSQEFRLYFMEALDTLCQDPNSLTRGPDDNLKTQDHAFCKLMYKEFTPEDRSGLTTRVVDQKREEWNGTCTLDVLRARLDKLPTLEIVNGNPPIYPKGEKHSKGAIVGKFVAKIPDKVAVVGRLPRKLAAKAASQAASSTSSVASSVKESFKSMFRAPKSPPSGS